MDIEDFEVAVVKVMHSRRVYGAKHIRLENIVRSGFRSHEHGEVKKAINNLIKKGIILYAKKSKNAIQLNKNKLKEIMEIVRK